eukprot:919272-Amphidinium_carterae.1
MQPACNLLQCMNIHRTCKGQLPALHDIFDTHAVGFLWVASDSVTPLASCLPSSTTSPPLTTQILLLFFTVLSLQESHSQRDFHCKSSESPPLRPRKPLGGQRLGMEASSLHGLLKALVSARFGCKVLCAKAGWCHQARTPLPRMLSSRSHINIVMTTCVRLENLGWMLFSLDSAWYAIKYP